MSMTIAIGTLRLTSGVWQLQRGLRTVPTRLGCHP
jgi:hypothetical protein